MAVHSTTKTEHRSVVGAAARRFLVTAGLTVAGAALTFAFSSTAWAEDTSASSGTGQSSTTAAVTAESSASSSNSSSSAEPAEAPAAESSGSSGSSGSSEPAQSTGKTSTQAKTPKTTEPEPDSADTMMATTATTAATTAEDEPEPVQKSSGGGLLGGLLNTVGGVLNAVTSTVGSVGDAVLKPIVAPIMAPIDHCPGGSDIVVTIAELDSGFDAWPAPATGDARGSTSTVAAVTPDTATVTGTTEAPAGEPEPARVPPTQPTTIVAPVKHHSAPAPAAPAPQSDDDAKVRAGAGGGGGSPGGGAPSAPPCAPAGHSASAHPGQDNNGSRGHFGVLPSSDSTTQLRLIGTSRDHAADGAGRDAALPTTSPD